MSGAPWAADNLGEKAEALLAALGPVELVERMPDGSRAVRLHAGCFHMLVGAGGNVDRYIFGDGVGWSEVRLEVAVGAVGSPRIVLHCEKIDAAKAVS